VQEAPNVAVWSDDQNFSDAGSKLAQQPYSWLSPAAFWLPRWDFSSRTAHLPFYFWLTDATRPRLIVDLVAGRPDDYLAFCQAIKQLNYGAECYGVTDIFDKHDPQNEANSPGAYHDAHFDNISHLEDAPSGIFDALGARTIDLLCIDGLQTSRRSGIVAQQWLARLSPQALVIIVHPEHLPPSWWKVLKKRPSFTLNAKPNVILIAATGTYPPQLSHAFRDADDPVAATMRSTFEHFGSSLRERALHRDTALFASRVETSLAHQSAAADLLRADKTELEEKTRLQAQEHIRDEARIAVLEKYVEQFRAEVLRLQEYAIKAQTEIERVQRIVGDRDLEIERLQRVIADRDTEVRRLGNYVQRIRSDNIKRISALDDKIQEGEDEILRLSSLVSQSESEIARLSELVAGGEREIARLNQQGESEIARLSELIADGEREIARLNQQGESEIARLNQLIVDRERENDRLNRLVTDNENESARTINQLVNEREGTVARLNQVIVDSHRENNRLNQVIVDSERENTRLNKLIIDRENEIALSIDQLVVEHESKVARLNDIIADRSREAASREARLTAEILQSASRVNDLQARVVDLENTINHITQSTAWKITRPFRLLFARLPRSARFLRRAVKLVWWTFSLQLISRLRHSRQRRSRPAVISAGSASDKPSTLPSPDAGSRAPDGGAGQILNSIAMETEATPNRKSGEAASEPEATAAVPDHSPGVFTSGGSLLRNPSAETHRLPASASNIEHIRETASNPAPEGAGFGSEAMVAVLEDLPGVLMSDGNCLPESASEAPAPPVPASKSEHVRVETPGRNREDTPSGPAITPVPDRLPCASNTDALLQGASETPASPCSSISMEAVFARIHDFEDRVNGLASSISLLAAPAPPPHVVDRTPEVHQLGIGLERESARIQHIENRMLHLASIVELERHRTDYALLAVDGMLQEIELYHGTRATADYNRVFRQQAPLVSICVSTMNRSDILIERCLKSLVNQSYRNIQIIVVGDHCTDDTGSRIARLRDDRISFHNLSSRGPYPPPGTDRWMVAGTNAINAAMSMCEGQFVTHLDDDDAATTDRIETLVNAAQQHKADFCWHPFWCENRDGSWFRLGDGRFELAQITTGSIFYHHYFRKFPWDVFAYRTHEPGDWNRLRKIRSLRPTLHFVDRPLMFHYSEGSQRPFTRRSGESFIE
jgi:Glycosyl transferase family 2